MSTSFLPFLYPARLVQRPVRAPVVRQFLRSLHATAPRGDQQKQPAPERPHRPSSASKAARRLHNDHIPFELPADFDTEGTDATTDADGYIRVGTGDKEDGTITPLERQAFRRIFREISRRQPETGETGSEADANDAQTAEGKNSSAAGVGSQRARINAIVGEASNDQVLVREAPRNRWREDDLAAGGMMGLETGNIGLDVEDGDSTLTTHVRDRVLAQFPPSLRSAAGKALGINDARRQQRQQQGEESGEEVVVDAEDEGAFAHKTAEAVSPAQRARRERQERMELAMLSKKTDVALWQYMEEQVFALVDKWGLVHETATGASASASKRTTTTARRKKALAEDRPLYPALLLHGQRLLDSRFAGGTTSPLALAVLPRIKALGLASFVLGASTPLYNHLMHIRWRRQGDAPAVFALLQEMQRAGLAFDAATLAVVKSIEWHVVPLTREGLIDGGPVAEENAVAAAAVQHLPDLAAVVQQAAYWRQQVERTVLRRQR
ncbi:hypothetical protein SCUCBS95973_007964 [Sporothrix curviconia]|uniref:Mtf2-like C-terminal domain-containing protein n=1 Tax=Sporothrix curviconia TaxID=1260050 RepID=A0ABP0CI64_9PEZI